MNMTETVANNSSEHMTWIGPEKRLSDVGIGAVADMPLGEWSRDERLEIRGKRRGFQLRVVRQACVGQCRAVVQKQEQEQVRPAIL